MAEDFLSTAKTSGDLVTFAMRTLLLLSLVAASASAATSSSNSTAVCGGQFLCSGSGACIPLTQRCDGRRDCSNGEDETDCGIKCDIAHLWQCASRDECISKFWRCDGDADCKDFSDEVGCDPFFNKGHSCADSEFRCAESGLCLPKIWICDGTRDCNDGSDESPDICIPTAPPPCKGFRCRSDDQCIPHGWLCDNRKDCTEGEDEGGMCDSMHPVESCDSGAGLFLCKDRHRCLSSSLVCDGKRHCVDGSDEGPGCSEACGATNVTSASPTCVGDAKCFPTPSGGACYCEKGFSMTPEGLCVDVNECHIYGTCSQDCKNNVGGFFCFCRPGYEMDNATKTCKALNSNPILIFSTKKELRALEFGNHGSNYWSISNNASTLNDAVGVSFDGIGGRVYWSAIHEDKHGILSSRLDGTNVRSEIDVGLVKPEDVSIDYIGRNVYFTDSQAKIIGVVSMDTKFWTTIISQNVDKPRGIAVFPERGFLFYADWGTQPGIMRAGMDGANLQRIVKMPEGDWPNGVAIDSVLDRVFWSEAKRHTLESARIDGSDRKIISMGNVGHPFSIALFEDTIFWSDWETKSIKSANKFTGKNETVLLKEGHLFPMGITIYHPILERISIANPCAGLSFCSHMCLLKAWGGFTCACPHGMNMSGSGLCEPPRAEVLFRDGDATIELEKEMADDNETLETLTSEVGKMVRDEEKLEEDIQKELEIVEIEEREKIEPVASTKSPAKTNDGTVQKDRVAGTKSSVKKNEGIVLGIIIPIIIILLVGLAVYLLLKRRKAKATGVSMRFRNPSFVIGPGEELKHAPAAEPRLNNSTAVEIDGSTSTPALGPRSNTMASSMSGTSGATSEDLDHFGVTDKAHLLP